MPSATNNLEKPPTAPITTVDKVLTTLPSTSHLPKTTQHILQETESQWLFSEAELARSPSILAGLAAEEERHLRAKGLSFIVQVGIMLKLPQITLYTASLFFNRFLMRYALSSPSKKPMRHASGARPLHVYQIGALALHTSTKVSETPRKVKDIITACVRVALHDASLLVPEDSKDFWRWRDTLLMHEDLFLETLCFDLTVESPHRLLFDLLRNLGAEHHKRLRNAAWAFVNDAGVTSLGLRFSARVVAGAAIYTAAKHCEHVGEGEGTRFHDDRRTGKPWWTAHHLALKDIRRCCNAMADLYESDADKHVSTVDRDGLSGSEEASKEETAPQSLDWSDENIYSRLRTPSNGPEEEAPTRAIKKRDSSVKRSRDGTPRIESTENRRPSINQGSSIEAEAGSDRIANEDNRNVAEKGKQDGEDEQSRISKKMKTDDEHPRAQKSDDFTSEIIDDQEGSEEGELEE